MMQTSKGKTFFQNLCTKYKIRTKWRPEMLIGFVENLKIQKKLRKKFYIYYLAGYPVSGQINIRYNPNYYRVSRMTSNLEYNSFASFNQAIPV